MVQVIKKKKKKKLCYISLPILVVLPLYICEMKQYEYDYASKLITQEVTRLRLFFLRTSLQKKVFHPNLKKSVIRKLIQK